VIDLQARRNSGTPTRSAPPGRTLRAAMCIYRPPPVSVIAGQQQGAQRGRDHAVRQAEIRRLALALRQARRQLDAS
jgi:hypothetical protein